MGTPPHRRQKARVRPGRAQAVQFAANVLPIIAHALAASHIKLIVNQRQHDEIAANDPRTVLIPEGEIPGKPAVGTDPSLHLRRPIDEGSLWETERDHLPIVLARRHPRDTVPELRKRKQLLAALTPTC